MVELPRHLPPAPSHQDGHVLTWLLRRTGPVGYRALLRIPGARPLLWFGLIGRFPNSMYPVGLVFAGEAITGSYGIGGSASAGFSLAAAVARPFGGYLVDRYGQRLMARALLAAFVAVSLGLLAVIRLFSAPWVIVMLAVGAGLTVPNVGSLTRVRWSGMAKRSDLTRWQALESVNDEINFIVGPSVVSLMAAWLTASMSLLTALALAVIGTLGVTALPGEPIAVRTRWEKGTRWMKATHLTVLGSVAGLGMVLGGLMVTVVAYPAELGYPAWSAVIFPLNAAASLVAALVVGRMMTGDLVSGHRKATLWLLAVLIPYSLGEGIVWFAVSATVAGLGTSPNLIQANSLVAATTSLERRTEAFSWIASAAGIGIAAGSVITGLLVDAIGAGQTRIWVTAFGACPAAITLVTSLRKPRRT